MNQENEETQPLKVKESVADSVKKFFFKEPNYLSKYSGILATERLSVQKNGKYNKDNADLRDEILKSAFGYRKRTYFFSRREIRAIKLFHYYIKELGYMMGTRYPTRSVVVRQIIYVFLVQDVFGLMKTLREEVQRKKNGEPESEFKDKYEIERDEEQKINRSKSLWWSMHGKKLHEDHVKGDKPFEFPDSKKKMIKGLLDDLTDEE